MCASSNKTARAYRAGTKEPGRDLVCRLKRWSSGKGETDRGNAGMGITLSVRASVLRRTSFDREGIYYRI